MELKGQRKTIWDRFEAWYPYKWYNWADIMEISGPGPAMNLANECLCIVGWRWVNGSCHQGQGPTVRGHMAWCLYVGFCSKVRVDSLGGLGWTGVSIFGMLPHPTFPSALFCHICPSYGCTLCFNAPCPAPFHPFPVDFNPFPFPTVLRNPYPVLM